MDIYYLIHVDVVVLSYHNDIVFATNTCQSDKLLTKGVQTFVTYFNEK